jgi:hypothetical protein
VRRQARSSRSLKALIATAACLGALLVANVATASAGVAWEANAHHGPTTFQAGGLGEYVFFVENSGDTPSSGPVQAQVELPQGVTTRVEAHPFIGKTWLTTLPNEVAASGWDCTVPGSEGPVQPAPGASTLTCKALIDPVTPDGNGSPRGLGRLTVYVDIAADAEGELPATATVSGGGGETVSVTEVATVAPPEAKFGIEPGSVEADAYDRDGQPLRQAGARPLRAVAAFDFNRKRIFPSFFGGQQYPMLDPIDTVRTITTELPRGFLGNPGAIARCDQRDFTAGFFIGGGTACPPSSQAGVLQVAQQSPLTLSSPPVINTVPVYNLDPPKRALADFGVQLADRWAHIYASLDPSDYSVVVRVPNINEELPIHYQRLILWGDPSDPIHDGARFNPEAQATGAPFEGERRPFLSLPTECGVPGQSRFDLFSWAEADDGPIHDGPHLTDPVELTGCDQLEFEPTIDVKPTTNLADAPAGLEFEMQIPQSEDVNGLATAHLRDAVVTLPEGMTVNPPSADGLGACSMAQVGIGANAVPNGSSVTCPGSSKLGTLEAESPAVEHPLKGEVFLAEQGANPFGSLIALYLVISDPETGVLVKLPGRVDPDPVTGQLTATFRDNPQLPVEELRLKFFEGPHAALKTPDSCGAHTTTSTLTPWSSPEGADAKPSSSFELTQGPAGGACLPDGGAAPNSPSFTAGTLDPTAKAFTPFTLKLARADGTQRLAAIDTTLPKGLLAKLAGTTYCPDAALASAAAKSGRGERAFPSCPASSHVGAVNVGAGAGSTPLYVQGQAYLAGPYKGAPLSLAIVTPAVAGPFDLGTVVVRTALHVNSESAQVHAVSDELPHILQGIPLNVRSISLTMGRPEFTLNPTSCDPMSIDGSALSLFGQGAPLSSPFQVGECGLLGFKPKLSIRLKGDTKRGGHPALTAVVKARPGDANIARASVALPRSEFLAQSHIRTICTRVQFAADNCPKGSVYGTATATTPLLDEALKGNAYLRSSNNPLPDLVIALKGKIDVDLVGRIDTDGNGGIRTTFATVPDAPVSKFTLRMQGGKKSLLENSRNLCSSTNRATSRMSAQSGKQLDSRPVVRSAGCGSKARSGAKRRGGER